MNKEQYVETIEKALVGHVSPQELQDTVTYYRDYIEMEIRKGKTEQEVLEELGNPRLLAKTIIMAKEHKAEQADEDTPGAETAKGTHQSGGVNIPLPILILIIVLILMMIFSAIVSVLRFLMPIVVPIAAILIIISFVKKWKK